VAIVVPASKAMITEHHGAKMAALQQLLPHWFQFDFRNGTSNKQPATRQGWQSEQPWHWQISCAQLIEHCLANIHVSLSLWMIVGGGGFLIFVLLNSIINLTYFSLLASFY